MVNGILYNVEGKLNFYVRNDGYMKLFYYKIIFNIGFING